MQATWYKVTIEFQEPILGTVPKNKEIYRTYIESKREERELAGVPIVGFTEEGPVHSGTPDDESATVPDAATEAEQRGWTGFREDEEGPFVLDYSVRGHLKETANLLKEQLRVQNARSKVENYVFVWPRRLHFHPAGGEPLKNGVNERPLRAQTPQGPRVSLMRSDTIENGALTFYLILLANRDITQEFLEELLAYGQLRGMGQWRNGGWGRYTVTEFEKLTEPPTAFTRIVTAT